MKRAKQHHLKPRNPLVAAALLKKAGAHQRKDKRAERARSQRQWRKEYNQLNET